MIKKQNGTWSDYHSPMEFLHAYLSDGGKIIIRRRVFLPPPLWSAEEHERETKFWGNMAFTALGLPERKEHHEFLTNTLPIDAAARFLNLPSNKVGQDCKNGAFGAIKIEGSWRIYKPSLQRYQEARSEVTIEGDS